MTEAQDRRAVLRTRLAARVRGRCSTLTCQGSGLLLNWRSGGAGPTLCGWSGSGGLGEIEGGSLGSDALAGCPTRPCGTFRSFRDKPAHGVPV